MPLTNRYYFGLEENDMYTVDKITEIRNSEKFRQKITCNCSDCGGNRHKGSCNFEVVFYNLNKSSLKVTAL